MQGGATFAEVLDESLRAPQPEAAAANRQASFRTAPLNPFVFSLHETLPAARTAALAAARVHVWVTPGVGAATAQRAASRPAAAAQAGRAPEPAETVAVKPAARPVRRLTRSQQHSFDTFMQFGAVLAAEFSAQELRAAFRALARRYHPDRHPFASQAETSALARQFTTITAHYEILRSVLGPADC